MSHLYYKLNQLVCREINLETCFNIAPESSFRYLHWWPVLEISRVGLTTLQTGVCVEWLRSPKRHEAVSRQRMLRWWLAISEWCSCCSLDLRLLILEARASLSWQLESPNLEFEICVTWRWAARFKSSPKRPNSVLKLSLPRILHLSFKVSRSQLALARGPRYNIRSMKRLLWHYCLLCEAYLAAIIHSTADCNHFLRHRESYIRCN